MDKVDGIKSANDIVNDIATTNNINFLKDKVDDINFGNAIVKGIKTTKAM